MHKKSLPKPDKCKTSLLLPPKHRPMLCRSSLFSIYLPSPSPKPNTENKLHQEAIPTLSIPKLKEGITDLSMVLLTRTDLHL